MKLTSEIKSRYKNTTAQIKVSAKINANFAKVGGFFVYINKTVDLGHMTNHKGTKISNEK
jgi:hypothetical protein